MANNIDDIKTFAEVEMTDKEWKHLAAAWLSHRSPEDFDIDIFTKLTEHPNTTNARKRFGEIKKRVRERLNLGDIPAKSTATPKKAAGTKAVTPKKRKQDADGAMDIDGPAPKTPAKRGKGKMAGNDESEAEGVKTKHEPEVKGEEDDDALGDI